MFLERRVYQGSSGRVYPLPFYDRIAETPTPFTWDSIELENEFLRVLILPQLGGRIHRIVDKTNGYDLVYHQPVIKPALVGLAGPWASGGIEFNWPQHHRPSTFMPTDVDIEHADDGSITVWLSEHDPMARMKGMHGVCLRPGRAFLELKARVHNRTDDVQTFLWWANVATRVHEAYQSFFPPDTAYIADHAKRATSTFPLCTGRYYGVDYAARARAGVPAREQPRQYLPPHCQPSPTRPRTTSSLPHYAPNDLSWYANIPVPTSYMCMGSQQDFFGGYDYKADAGLVHVASHHISPGKKQWTWGNHEFGYAWDRNLTDPDEHGEHAPYIELMAGVYTDNQPDFSYLQPGETKHWSQHWYPIRAIGPAQHANIDAAISLQLHDHTARLGVAVTAHHDRALILLLDLNGRRLLRRETDLAPDRPFLTSLKLRRRPPAALTLRVLTSGGRELIRYSPAPARPDTTPVAATEPPLPADVASSDELYVIGLHLEQYRHATRCPTLYWREALRRDAGDSRCHLALGRWHLRRGEWRESESHLRASIARLTSRNPNPADGEPHYQLGRCLRYQADSATPNSARALLESAYAAFYKATWNQAWAASSFHALAEIDCRRGDWSAALDHLERSLSFNTSNLRARDLKAIVLRQLGRTDEADAFIAATLALDPLDHWARHLRGEPLTCDTATRIDLAIDHARAGLHREALDLLAHATPEPLSGNAPVLHYYRGWLHAQLGETAAARRARAAAASSPLDHCFPARLEDALVLQSALAANPRDATAHTCLGHLLYDRRRHREAIAHWQQAVRLAPRNAVAWRCLGLGAFNILRQPDRARRAYERAVRCAPTDARLLYERDQLWKRLGVAPAKRLRELERHRDLVSARDDLSLELCALYNQTGRPRDALAILSTRRFQPWEGGEGQALQQHVRTHLLLGRAALAQQDHAGARRLFEAALDVPPNLGEARHLLANPGDIHFWLGEACAAAGDTASAKHHWTSAATFAGDFQQMRVQSFSEMTYYSALAWQRLGRSARARKLLRDLLDHARALARQPATIDYFATSLPTLLLFEDDLQARQLTTARFLAAQAQLGLGQRAAARRLLRDVLQRDPSHALAQDLASSF